MNEAEITLLYRFIDEACTNRQIQDFLRRKKIDGVKVKIGQNAGQIIANLKEAHNSGHVTEKELITLLAMGEENGRQHIFFYRLKKHLASKFSDLDQVYSHLKQTLKVANQPLPHFVLKPRERTVSDIRFQELNGEIRNLIVKWYSGREYEEEISRKTEQRNGDRIVIRESKIEEVRLVSLMRYHPRGLLEVRVPTGARESRKTCLAELDSIWHSLSPVITKDDFVELDLCEAMKQLNIAASKPKATHRVCGSQAADGGATAEFNPAMEGEDLFASLKHREAMAHYDTVCRLDVWWRSPSMKGVSRKKFDPTDEIRGQMGVYVNYGIRFGAKRTREEMDFVINRLWDLSKPKR